MALNEKIVLITGAAQGIGQGIAVKFAEEKAKIAIFDISETKKTLKQIEEIGGEATWLEVDVSDETQVQAAIESIIAKWGKIDILVNNAGIFPIEHFHEMSVKLFRKILDINVIGTFICSRYVIKHLLSQKKGGAIINIASVGGMREELYHSHYGASKAAIVSLTKSMALELGKYGIRVNAIAPGAISTKGARTATPFPESGIIPEDFMEFQKQKRSPLGGMGNPEDIANMALYLASEKAKYITGAVIAIDGGRSLQ
ncbi:MAG TPA: SDR family NAD(P)-dependent oxidoreductase [Candidatus Deferrimicrobium sp.]|nr:SDR family NAD(P)-dependent oxidoreductase [Candidatus Deferrimicrobium sp.]